MQRWWFEERVLGPATDLLRALNVGEVAQVVDGAGAVATAVEALIRSEVAPTWPGPVTTDGSQVHACGRPSPDEVVVVGTATHDFGPSAFPFRAHLVPGRQRVRVELGEVDPATAVPTPMDRPILVVAVGDPAMREVEVIVGRRQWPVTWTEVLDVGPDDLEG